MPSSFRSNSPLQYSEGSPLLGSKFESRSAAATINGAPTASDAESEHGHGGKGTVASSIFNLMMSAVGAGMLSYPFAMASAGIVANCGWTVLFGVLVTYSLVITVRYAEKYRSRMSMFTFEELVFYAFGKKWYVFMITCVLITFYGSMIGFMIIIGDVTEPLLLLASKGHQVWWSSRIFAICAFTGVVILPLSFVGNVHNLVVASVIGIGSVLAVSGLVIYRGVDAIIKSTTGPAISTFIRPGWQLALAPPICVFSLGCSLQVIPIYAELREPDKRLMPVVIAVTEVICMLLYTATGLFGYVSFGVDTAQDILTNFALGDIVADIAKFVMALHVTLAFPMSILPMKRTMLFLLQQCGAKLEMNKVYSVVSSVVILGMVVMVAIFLPQVALVFGLVGSTTNVVLMFFVPGALLLSGPPDEPAPDEPAPTPATSYGVGSPDAADRKRFYRPDNVTDDDLHSLLHPSERGLKVGWQDGSRTPGRRDDVWRRVFAIALIVIGALTGLVGTGVNIQQNFFPNAI
eukprot:TRINITY_DN2490_c0_g2_i1.p1 TRINITY_DN2490_c0_g2~~TRINITY_DN2490_c0_g2_i1.p1  ORF type:complete len:519 (+),score=189.08 TRINITY_DN2490_c0_g2_i1:132-1688(+)